MTRPNLADSRGLLALALILAASSFSVPAAAGTGFGVSGASIVDTIAPDLAVDDVPQHAVFQAGQVVTFRWTVGDDNPGLAGGGENLAELRLGEILADTFNFDPATPVHQWQWSVTDTTTGTAHLDVHATDTFGNRTTVTTSDFTILSSATDVPRDAVASVFAPPVPNPFNPQTELRFNLPATGPVAITVHDARGYRVATLLRSVVPAGPLTLRWNGTDDRGRRQAGGTYFFRLVHGTEHPGATIVRKGVLLP